jgi:hypothetical protein
MSEETVTAVAVVVDVVDASQVQQRVLTQKTPKRNHMKPPVKRIPQKVRLQLAVAAAAVQQVRV